MFHLFPRVLRRGLSRDDLSSDISAEEAPSWKFWQKLHIRRGDQKQKELEKLRSDLENGNLPIVDISQIEEETGKAQRSQSLRPPPKPPRMFLFRSSSISTPRNSTVINPGSERNSIIMSQAYQNSRSRDNANIPTALVAPVRQEVPAQTTENNNDILEKDAIITNPDNVKPIITRPVRGEQVFTPNRIKIVTPDLTPRRNFSRQRRASEIVPQEERHKLIIQSSLELLCQKFDPLTIINELKEKNIISEDDIQAFQEHPDRRLVCESILHNLLEGPYSKFFIFCDILRDSSDYKNLALIMDVMKDTYDVVYNIPAIASEEIPVMEEEKTVTFEIGYFNAETGVMKPVVELEKTRDSSKRFSRDSLFFKRASRLSYMSVSSEGRGNDDSVLINHGTPVINICISGHSLHEGRVKSLAKVVSKYNCILELRIGKTQLSGRDIGHLSPAIQASTCLTVLDLRLNSIGNEGARLLAVPLTKNSHLRQLNISSTGIDHEGCKNLSDALKLNNTLTDLDMSFLEIGDSGCICLGNMLKANKSISKMRLRSSGISWIGCGILFEGVQQSRSLCVLDLSRNFIGDNGMEMMCRHLNEKSALVDLNLENCGITSVGCAMLSDVILSNKTLTNLDISVNFIADAGVAKLSAALERNKSIKTLGLNMCGITNDGFSKLLDVLECNPTMTLLKLCYNRLGKEHSNPSATSDDLKYRVRIVTSSNPKLKILLWGNSFDD
ncbi:uncharacterized protein LOC125657204 isoform X3 [Ostrea edulis]|uniref:uncharacterized protein LOC125657204 isoform X3 n=1 Tax=Ostrea edulis TaxID=37623 RepID=UPI002094FE3E|nr:uncharacterized protein LOC125657204 isoform X3 [Ostrea edulis]